MGLKPLDVGPSTGEEGKEGEKTDNDTKGIIIVLAITCTCTVSILQCSLLYWCNTLFDNNDYSNSNNNYLMRHCFVTC